MRTIRRNRLPALLTFVACATACVPASAEWVTATRNAATGATTSYDTARVVRNGATLEVWTRSEGAGHKAALLAAYRRSALSPTQVQTLDDRFAYRLTRWRLDCDKRLARPLAVADYDVHGDAFYVSEEAGSEETIFPDSVLDAATQRLCAPAPRGKRK